MSFVKDDHSYTRGVGAIAATDKGSPRRRLAVARAARVMARRDGMMARSTLGAISLLDVNSIAQTGANQFSAALPPPPGVFPPFPAPTRTPVSQLAVNTKLPGTFLATVDAAPAIKPPVITVVPTIRPASVDMTPPKTTSNPLPTPVPTTVVPATKTVVTVVGSGAGFKIVGNGSTNVDGSAVFPTIAPLDLSPTHDEPPTPAPAPTKPTNHLLMYAAIGLGAWLLLRK